jgi:AAHS family 4-hydroxybenzoate transporter-like MFS transporter
MPGKRFDVAAFIDARPIGWREITLLVVCSVVLFIDGFDMYFFGKVLPAVADGLGVTPKQMTGVVTAQQVGMALGAFVMPPLADKIGRKPVLALCMATFGVLTFLAAWSTSVVIMAWLRGVAGIFFSAMLPVALALLAEMTPRRRRASFLSIALVCFSAANIASGAMTAWLLDIYGWQIGFWLGGLLPLAALPLLLAIPESLPFRITRDARDPRIANTIRRLDTSAAVVGGEEFVLGDTPRSGKKIGPLAMFRQPYFRQTLLLFSAAFLAMGNIALLANWLPTYFQVLGGVPIQQFAKNMIIGFMGGALGSLVIGRLMDRLNPYAAIAGFYVLDALALASLGYLPAGTVAFIAGLVAWNFCQTGGQTGMNTWTTLNYPPEMRSSGLGWAGAVGRIAGVILPLAGGMALGTSLTLRTIMLLIALPPLIVAGLMLLLGSKGTLRPSEAKPVPA